MTEKEIQKLNSPDLLDKYEELLKEEAKRPKAFAKDKAKSDLLCKIYEEVLLRVFETNARR